MATTTTKELSIAIAFADSTKRSLKFTGVPESAEATLKARVKAIKNGTDNENAIGDWQQFLRSAGGASATGITGATYTITQVTPIYDSATYDG